MPSSVYSSSQPAGTLDVAAAGAGAAAPAFLAAILAFHAALAAALGSSAAPALALLPPAAFPAPPPTLVMVAFSRGRSRPASPVSTSSACLRPVREEPMFRMLGWAAALRSCSSVNVRTFFLVSLMPRWGHSGFQGKPSSSTFFWMVRPRACRWDATW